MNTQKSKNSDEIKREESYELDLLYKALYDLYLETIDYITINHLGDPHHNRSMKQARDALNFKDTL